MPLDLSSVRSRFPALDREHGGHPVAYFDGPGGTQIPDRVVDTMADYLFRHNANTHWAYPASAETDSMLAESKRVMGDFLGCDPSEIAFGANTTSLLFHFTRALGRGLEEGDEIVTTRLDHQANIAPWKELAREHRLVVREVPFTAESGRLDMDALSDALSPRTRWVAVGAASNAIGTVTDLGRVRELANTVGAQLFVDAVHFAPHERTDVARMGADALACSPYKFYGPHAGAMFVSRRVLDGLEPPRLSCAGSEGAEILETGTLSHEAIVGSAAAVEFIGSLGVGSDLRSRLDDAFTTLHARGEELVRRLWEGLEAIDGVTLQGPPPGTPRTPTVAFWVEGVSSESVTRKLAERQGVFTSHGDFYATTVVEDLGRMPDGLVRAGAACFTTDEEVDRLVAGVAELAG